MHDEAVAGATAQADFRHRLRHFWGYAPFGRFGRIVIVGAAALVITVDLVLYLSGASGDTRSNLLAQLVLTASFALFAWRPPTAALVLIAEATLTVALGVGEEALLVSALGAGIVVATCSVPLAVVYSLAYAALLTGTAILVPHQQGLAWTAAFLFTFAIAVVVGVLVRRISQRAAHLSVELVERQRQLEEAVRVERERLADELHDFIAHELTIIAMHARVLEQTDDPEIQAESREAISSSARQALADIRRVLEITQASRLDGELDDPVVERRRLGPTVADIERELGSTGARVTTEGVYEAAERMSRTMEVALAQFVREAATNVVKHAPGTPWVSFRFTVEGEFVTARVENASVGTTESLALPTGGYGLARMRERAKVFGGSFEAGPTDEGWAVEVRLPVQ